jgi:hypothetical protein
VVSRRPAIGRAMVASGAAAIFVVAVASYFSLAGLASQVRFSSTSSSTLTFPSPGPAIPPSTVLRSNTQSTCSVTGAITMVPGDPTPPCGCALVVSNSIGSLWASRNPKVGDTVCIMATLNGSTRVSLGITDSAGVVMLSAQCVALQRGGPTFGASCMSLWDTARPDPQGNAIEAGTFLLVASGSLGAVPLEANITLA